MALVAAPGAPALPQQPTPGSSAATAASVDPPPPRGVSTELRPEAAEPLVATADLDPSNDDIVAPPDTLDDCEARLRAAGVVFTPATLPFTRGHGPTPACGAAQALVYRRGPARIRYNSAPLVSCSLALALPRFEAILNEEAQRLFGEPVARIEQGGTYNCRKMARFRLVSEHSYANAIDVRSIKLKSGRKLSVLSDFGSLERPPRRRESVFLRTVAERLYDEGVFSVVLTPFFDPLHRDHFHLDQARYRVDGTRP